MADGPRVEYYLAQCHTWAPHLYTVAYRVRFQFFFAIGWFSFFVILGAWSFNVDAWYLIAGGIVP
jgi:hypothetical protein